MSKFRILSTEEASLQIEREFCERNNISGAETTSTLNAKLTRSIGTLNVLNRFITSDPFMMDQKEKIKILAPLKDTVLITGPTGTGKEIFAQALAGHERDNNFLPLNCAALSDTLVESELFGHVKGAFTDAKSDHMGVLLAAREGTVYLDEIDKMPAGVQAKLLRAIQEHEIRRIGSTSYEKIFCRFVCSSKEPLENLLDKGFLPDLYARVSTFEIFTTPLAQRWGDVNLILTSFAVPEEHQTLNEKWTDKVNRFNVRGLESFARHWHVFHNVD